MKPFSEINAGDKGTDYAGEEIMIHAKGTLSKMIQDYGCPFDSDEFTSAGFNSDSPAVAVRHSQHPSVVVYTYGEGGVTVEDDFFERAEGLCDTSQFDDSILDIIKELHEENFAGKEIEEFLILRIKRFNAEGACEMLDKD